MLIALACLLPASMIETIPIDNLLSFDKVLHLLLFYILVSLWLLAQRRDGKLNHKAGIYTLLICTGYGILIEFLQNTTWSQRSFELGDIIADFLGSFLGLLLLKYLIKSLPFVNRHLPFTKGWY
jgi:VanZ family protein